MNRILAIDNDLSFLQAIKKTLEYNRFPTRTVSNPLSVPAILEEQTFDCILLDVAMPGVSGMEVLKQINTARPDIPVIMISGESTISIAVDAIKQGAYDFLEKPVETKRLLITIQKAIEKKSWAVEKTILLTELSETFQMVGQSEPMQRVFQAIETLAQTDTKILIRGETGTGKELVARALHNKSKRSGKRFVAVNCAAIPEALLESELFGHTKGSFSGAISNQPGKFRLADGGTLFLDEIGDLPLNMQAKLLRVLDNNEIETIGNSLPQKVDVRIISATNQDLKTLVKENRFREDLFHRIHVISIEIPSLNERKDDIPILAEYFLQKFGATYNKQLLGFSASALTHLQQHNWRGNVRELKNIIEKISVFTKNEMIQASDVFFALGMDRKTSRIPHHPLGLKEELGQYERDLLVIALTQHNWKMQQTADRLGIDRTTLFKKIHQYQIEKPVEAENNTKT